MLIRQSNFENKINTNTLKIVENHEKIDKQRKKKINIKK